MANILVVDDDRQILQLIENILKKSGHFIKKLQDPNQVFSEDLTYYQLIILDIMMPEIDGYQVCSAIRDRVDVPILFLTAKTGEADIIKGLGLGADDYLTKPFGVQELRARVDAHIRRDQREKRHATYIGPVKFLIDSKECFVGDTQVPLTKSEYEISEYLALHQGQVFSKEQMFEAVFGYERDSNLSAIVEHIKNIRAKFKQLGQEPIKTVWGIGYKWE